MKILLLTPISGTNGSFAEGEVTDWADDEDAKRLIEAGFAEKVGPAKKTKVEKATSNKSVETATE